MAAIDQERLLELGVGRPLHELYPEDHALAPGSHQLLIIEIGDHVLRYQLLNFSVEVLGSRIASWCLLLEPGGTYSTAELPLLFALIEAEKVEADEEPLRLKTTQMEPISDSNREFVNILKPATLYQVEGLNSGDYLFELSCKGSAESTRRVLTVNRDLKYVR